MRLERHMEEADKGINPLEAEFEISSSLWTDLTEIVDIELEEGEESSPSNLSPEPEEEATVPQGVASDEEPKETRMPRTVPYIDPKIALPRACVVRIMKSGLPPQAKISKEVKDMVTECAHEFIMFLMSEAVEASQIINARNTNGEDILRAMYTLDLDTYATTLEPYLYNYRRWKREKKQKRKLQNVEVYTSPVTQIREWESPLE